MGRGDAEGALFAMLDAGGAAGFAGFSRGNRPTSPCLRHGIGHAHRAGGRHLHGRGVQRLPSPSIFTPAMASRPTARNAARRAARLSGCFRRQALASPDPTQIRPGAAGAPARGVLRSSQRRRRNRRFGELEMIGCLRERRSALEQRQLRPVLSGQALKPARQFIQAARACRSGTLYTTRRRPGDVDRSSSDALSKMGYGAVELAGYLGRTPKHCARPSTKRALICPSSHVGADLVGGPAGPGRHRQK